MPNQEKKPTMTTKPEKTKSPSMSSKPAATVKNTPQKTPKR